jgi:hypothetical protein
MRFSSSEPAAAQSTDAHVSAAHVPRFSPTERMGTRQTSGAITAEIAAGSESARVLRGQSAPRDEVAAATPAAR